jgi:hypothetical protein
VTALTPEDLARIEEVDAQTREAAALYLWDEGIVRPESLARQVIDALVIDGWRPSAPALVAGVRSLQARITELEAEKAEAWDEGWDNGNDYALSDSFDDRASRQNNPHRAGANDG